MDFYQALKFVDNHYGKELRGDDGLISADAQRIISVAYCAPQLVAEMNRTKKFKTEGEKSFWSMVENSPALLSMLQTAMLFSATAEPLEMKQAKQNMANYFRLLQVPESTINIFMPYISSAIDFFEHLPDEKPVIQNDISPGTSTYLQNVFDKVTELTKTQKLDLAQILIAVAAIPKPLVVGPKIAITEVAQSWPSKITDFFASSSKEVKEMKHRSVEDRVAQFLASLVTVAPALEHFIIQPYVQREINGEMAWSNSFSLQHPQEVKRKIKQLSKQYELDSVLQLDLTKDSNGLYHIAAKGQSGALQHLVCAMSDRGTKPLLAMKDDDEENFQNVGNVDTLSS